MDEADRHALGTATRRAVLGDKHVDRATAGATPFTQPFQDLIARYAWGEIWTRAALPHETRRLLVLAMTIALNRPAEFRLHVRAALEGGVAPELIQEVILQAAIYCGVPAANSAFHDAAEILQEVGRAGAGGDPEARP